MIVRVNWAKPNSDGNQMYHVYQATDYLVEYMGWTGDSINGSKPHQARLVLDEDQHDILLSGGDSAFVMNDEGKTIDIIRT